MNRAPRAGLEKPYGTYVFESWVLGDTMAGSVTPPPLGGSGWLRTAAAELGRPLSADGARWELERDSDPGLFGELSPLADPPVDGGRGERTSLEVDCLSAVLPPPSESLLPPNSFDMNFVYSLALPATGGALASSTGLWVSEPLEMSVGGTLCTSRWEGENVGV